MYIEPVPGRSFCLEGIGKLMHASDTTTSPDAILARVRDVFRTELDDEELVIGPDTSQKNLRAWDSLAHIRLVSGIESEFDIQFSLAEIEQITSVRQFVQLIEQRTR
jgi:acyl carrier protein